MDHLDHSSLQGKGPCSNIIKDIFAVNCPNEIFSAKDFELKGLIPMNILRLSINGFLLGDPALP